MTESQINFNYNKSMGQAKELKSIAKQIKSLSEGKFQDSISAIDKNWDGDSSKKFVNKGRTLKGKMDKSSGKLDEIAGAVEEIAGNIYRSEMNALRIAQTKSH